MIRPGAVEDRLYQQRIARTSLEGNTLVILPTALGKTVIALLVIARRLERYPKGKIAFLAPTKPLAIQHRDTLAEKLTVAEEDLAVLTGEIQPPMREDMWNRARIVFATPQTVRNDIREGRYDLRYVSLIVIDEAHRTRGDYPYGEIAQAYVSQCSDPLILALTASPGGSRKRIMEMCEDLFIESVEYRTETDPDVRPYVNPIEVRWHGVELPKEYVEVKAELKDLFRGEVSALRALGFLRFKSPSKISRRDLLLLGEELRRRIDRGIKEEGYLYSAVSKQAAAMSLAHAMELLESQGMGVLRVFLNRMVDPQREERYVKRIVRSPGFQRVLRLVEEYKHIEHPKLGRLRQLIAEQLERDRGSRIIVFTQYRDTASVILSTLDGVEGVRAVRFVGQQSKTEDAGLTQSEQARILRDLRSGAYNVLVATSIAEEGLDIPSVELVIFYEPIPSEIRYIQRRGRTARRAAGRAEILMTKRSLDEAYYWSSKRREEGMRRTVATLNRKLGMRLKRAPIVWPPSSRAGAEPERAEGLAEENGSAEHGPLVQTRLTHEPISVVARGDLKGLYRTTKWVVRMLGSSDAEDGVKMTKLLEAGVENGIKPTQLRASLEKLTMEGAVWYPKPGRVKLLS